MLFNNGADIDRTLALEDRQIALEGLTENNLLDIVYLLLD
jgi:hypothetical protein